MKSTKVTFRAPGSSLQPRARGHRLSICTRTGLARFRDRHQARDGIRGLASNTRALASTFACPDCRGFHIDTSEAPRPARVVTAAPVEAFTSSLSSRKRRYFLVDIENPTRVAQGTAEQAARLWDLIKQQAPGVAPSDHVVVGAGRAVAARYRAAIDGANVKWVVGPSAKDGADRALLAAVDLHRVARLYDELVIVSGDHAFTPLARRAKLLGLSVHVVTAEHPSGRTMLSRELSNAADLRTLIRLQGRSHHTQSVSAARAMSGSWRRNVQDTAA